MATTTNYGWTTPDDTALVKDGASAIRTLGSSVDTTTKALNPETTLGDIAYRSSTANVKTRLGLGTAGQVLTVNSGATAPEWATIAAGGMTLISTTTFTGASITLSSIPATYNDLKLVIRNYRPTNDGEWILMRFNGISTSSYRYNAGYGVTSNQTFNSTEIVINDGAGNDNTTATGLTEIIIPDYANTVTWKIGRAESVMVNPTTTTNANIASSQFQFNGTAALSSITLFAGSGNLTSGTALLYGVK